MDRFRDFIEKRGSKVLFTFFLIQLGIFLVAITVCWSQQPVYQNDEKRQNLFKWLILIELYGFQSYYSYHAVLKQNVIELFACLVISLCTTFCGGYRFVSVISENDKIASTILAILQVSTSILLQIFLIIASYYLWDIFKWNIFQRIGGNYTVQSLYTTYERFKALLKLFCGIGFILSLSCLLFIKKPDFYNIALDFIAIAINISIFFIGYQGVRKEKQKLMISFWSIIGVLFSLTIFSLALLYFHPKWASLNKDLFSMDINCEIIVLLLVLCYISSFGLSIFYSVKASQGFQKGLRELLIQKKQESMEEDFLSERESQISD